jgi:predicted small secreted protein
MSGNKQQFWTVIVSLLIASALISACGTSSGKDITPGTTLTAATLVTPTPETIAAASPVPPPSPGPEITFPLALGNTWVYQFTRYEGAPTTEIITTTRIITETVVEVKDVSSYLVAKVHQEKSAEVPVGEVPPSWKGAPLEPATSTYYWLVVSGNRMYRQEGNLDLSNLSTALVEFVFPVKLGEKWYRSDEKARLNPTYADDWMLRKVTKVGTVVVPAGEFNDCFFLEEEWAGTIFETWFCPKVGIVSEKGDHHGTPYGFRRVLIRYHLNK